MIETLTGDVRRLGAGVEQSLAAYRHKIFIEKLGWQLPVEAGRERDQFDGEDTIYVLNRQAGGAICGCARLLPTTRPYLLSEVFPHLLAGAEVPRSPEVWELSRFSSDGLGAGVFGADAMAENTRTLLRAVVKTAMAQGARRLITVSPLGIDRILRRMGVNARFAAPPQRVDGKPVFACWIELDRKTAEGLSVLVPESRYQDRQGELAKVA